VKLIGVVDRGSSVGQEGRDGMSQPKGIDGELMADDTSCFRGRWGLIGQIWYG
jgi:hypothetical protein